MLAVIVLLSMLVHETFPCAATGGGETVTTTAATVTTTTGTCGVTCTKEQVTLTPGSATPGTFTPTSTFTCPTLVVECDAGAGKIAFMQFNVNEGGPLENQGMTQVVTVTLTCINNQWTYDNGNRVVNEVNCMGA